MTRQLSKTQKASLAGALLLGNAIPMAARAQSVGVMRVNDDVVAKFISGSQYGLYDVKKDPSHCIGIFDPAAFQQGKDSLIPAGLSNAAELQAINDAAPVYNGKHFVQMTLYKGPPVQLGDCSIAQAPTNYAAAAQTSTPAQNPQDVVAAQMAALSNSIKLQFKIVKANAKKAEILITDSHNLHHTLTIEADASGVRAIRDSFAQQNNRATNDGNLKSWSGHSVRLAIDNSYARWYNPDGTPMVETENKSLGDSSTGIMAFWDKSTFADMADTIKAQLGTDPAYSAVLYAIAGKPAAAAPEPNGAR